MIPASRQRRPLFASAFGSNLQTGPLLLARSFTSWQELLVTLPVDFEDVVDINASLAAVERPSRDLLVNEFLH